MRVTLSCPMCGQKMCSVDPELAKAGFNTAIATASPDLKMIGGFFSTMLNKMPAEKLARGISSAMQMSGVICARCETPDLQES